MSNLEHQVKPRIGPTEEKKKKKRRRGGRECRLHDSRCKKNEIKKYFKKQ